MTSESKSKKPHYVCNETFTIEMTAFREACDKAEAEGKPRPLVTNSMGEKFMLIATRLAYRPNFYNYTYRDEMILDAIENQLQYCHNFDIKKSSNAFAYFSQIAFWAMVRRIQKEQKQFKTKAKYVQQRMSLTDILDSRQDQDTGEDYQNTYVDYLMDYYDVELSKLKPSGKKSSTDDTVIDEALK